MGADDVLQPILGVAAVGGMVGQHVGNSAQAEDAVGDEHGALIAPVDVPGDVLCARHQDAHVGVHLPTTSQGPSRGFPPARTVRLALGNHRDLDVKFQAAIFSS